MKVLKSLLIVILFLGILIPPNTGESASNAISEKDFVQLIKKSGSYKEFKKDLMDGEFFETTPENETIGRVARYEIEYGHTEEDLVKIASYLTFTYDYETGKFEEHLIDYSKVYEEMKVFVHNFTEGTIEEIDVSQNQAFTAYIDEINLNVEEALKEQEVATKTLGEEVDSMAAGTVCWQCTKYEASSHSRDSWCDYFFSVGCGVIGYKTTIAGWLLCSGAQGLACWIPAYRVCIAGQWMTVCPATT